MEEGMGAPAIWGRGVASDFPVRSPAPQVLLAMCIPVQAHDGRRAAGVVTCTGCRAATTRWRHRIITNLFSLRLRSPAALARIPCFMLHLVLLHTHPQHTSNCTRHFTLNARSCELTGMASSRAAGPQPGSTSHRRCQRAV